MGFIEFKNVCKVYNMGEVEIRALDDINFEIEKGEFVVVLGASGAGKTTILSTIHNAIRFILNQKPFCLYGYFSSKLTSRKCFTVIICSSLFSG